MTTALDSLPQEVQTLVRAKGYRGKTVSVGSTHMDVITELPPVPANLDNTNKPATLSYAVSPTGQTITANHNRVTGAWPHYREEEAESFKLPVEQGPWTIVHFVRDWGGKIILVSVRHGKSDTRYAKQKVAMSGFAAAMLYVYGNTSGEYRRRSRLAMRSYSIMVTPGWRATQELKATSDDGPPWLVARDQLLELGLVTLQRDGQVRLTPQGKEVARRIPYDYDPDRWVRYDRNLEATRVPSDGLHGLGATRECPFCHGEAYLHPAINTYVCSRCAAQRDAATGQWHLVSPRWSADSREYVRPDVKSEYRLEPYAVAASRALKRGSNLDGGADVTYAPTPEKVYRG